MTYPAYDPPRPPVPAEPPRPPAPADPWAVALGNATLLGIGYLLLRRWRLAAIAVLGTAVLLDLTASTARTRYEISYNFV